MDAKDYFATIMMLLLMINIQQCYSDLALIHFKSEIKHLLTHEQKHWYAYIRRLIVKFTEKNRFENSYSKMTLLRGLIFSKTFISFNKQILILNSSRNGKTSCYDKMLVSCPSGQVDLFLSSSHVQQHQYIYYMNNKLLLNITFISIVFDSGRINCDMDNLTVTNLEEKDQSYLYCGIYRLFNFYPKFSKLRIQITSTLHFKVYAKFKFIVIDKSSVYTLLRTKSTPEIVMFANKMGSSLVLIYYMIKVKRSYRILIFISSTRTNKYIVYDGPSLNLDHFASIGKE